MTENAEILACFKSVVQMPFVLLGSTKHFAIAKKATEEILMILVGNMNVL